MEKQSNYHSVRHQEFRKSQSRHQMFRLMIQPTCLDFGTPVFGSGCLATFCLDFRRSKIQCLNDQTALAANTFSLIRYNQIPVIIKKHRIEKFRGSSLFPWPYGYGFFGGSCRHQTKPQSLLVRRRTAPGKGPEQPPKQAVSAAATESPKGTVQVCPPGHSVFCRRYVC